MQCINKNTREYRTLLKESGLSDFELSAQVGRYLDTMGRFPYLDELIGANSEPTIKENLKLNSSNITSSENVLAHVNAESVQEAIPKLNDKYRDKEIEVLEINGKSKVYITERPKRGIPSGEIQPDSNINSMTYLNEVVEKLQNLYGIDIIPITNAELNTPEWEQVVGTHTVKAFIYNGNIYINTDNATVDSPIHELLHILFGSMKFQDRGMYEKIVQSAENFNSSIIEMYPNRTREDINEEAFITELAYYLTDQPSALDNLDPIIQQEIFYNMNRVLDSMLMGETSVNNIPKSQLYKMDLKTIARLVGSASMNSNFQGSMDDATLNRILANKKQDLMNKGELKEKCS